MLDVAIVGGGLCGLALAHSLQATKGISWGLYEARERLGGRVWTRHGPDGTPVDLGATWYWPDHQPNMRGLVQALGLRVMPQADDGRGTRHLPHMHGADEADEAAGDCVKGREAGRHGGVPRVGRRFGLRIGGGR